MIQKLVEKHIINRNHMYYQECDHLSFLSKNLYNATLYCFRQGFIKQGKMTTYGKLSQKFTQRNKPEYRALPAKVSKGTMRLVDKAISSFFALLTLKNEGKYDEVVNLPKYLHSVKGRQIVHYEKGALSFKKRPGYIHLSKTTIYIKTNIDQDDIQFVRIIPRGNHYVIEVGYKIKTYDLKDDNKRYASIDLGVNNLATIASNVITPIIINGKPIKSINQYYNKAISNQKRTLPFNVYSSKHIDNLYKRRNNKINDYLHKASRYIVNHLVSNQINTLIIGYNPGWKQDINIGKRNNQNFTQIPFKRFIDMLTYKCLLLGINIIINEESYTSKCSFLDNESVEKHDVYMGRRVKRGLYKTKEGQTINADLNGALNIMKKGLKVAWNDQLWSDCVEACSMPNIDKIKTFN